MTQAFTGSHSATVEMWLDCGEYGRVPLARITPTLVIAKEAREIPPGPARLIVTVDGERIDQHVMLTTGFSRGRLAARAVPIEDDGIPI